MKKTILALVAAGLLPLAGAAATPEPSTTPVPPPQASPPSAGSTTPAPTRFEPKTTYGDIARVLSSQPVYERSPSGRRECRMESSGYNSAATDVPRCEEPGGSGDRIVAY